MTPATASGEAPAGPGLRNRIVRCARWLRARDDGPVAWLMLLVPLGLLVARRMLTGTGYGVAVSQFCTIDQVRWIAFGIIAARELLFGRYDARAVGILALLVGLGVIAQGANYPIIVDGLVFAFAARNARFETVAKFLLVEYAVLLLVIVGGAAAGAIPDVVFEEGGARGDRHALGFRHPNNPGAYLLALMFLWACVRGRRFCWADAAGCLAVITGFFLFTDSRSTMLVSAVFLVLVAVFKHCPRKARSRRLLFAVGAAFIVGFAATSVVLCALYSPDMAWMAKLDSLASGRISLGHAALVEYGTTLFGQEIKLGTGAHFNVAKQAWVPGNGLIVIDNLYIRLVVTCGIAFTVAAMALVLNVVRHYAKRGDWMVVAILVAIASYAVYEAAPVNVCADPFIMLLAVPFGARERLGSVSWGRREPDCADGDAPHAESGNSLGATSSSVPQLAYDDARAGESGLANGAGNPGPGE